MTAYHYSLSEIVAHFQRLGIDISSPGFYDDPSFLAAESSSSVDLRHYARLVLGQRYSRAYLRAAADKIRVVTEVLHDEVEKDGRLDACIDAALVVSRILEREGVWNCILTGALTITYPPKITPHPRHYWPIDDTSAVAAHAWLYAPPFRVVDITIREQGHEPGLRSPLPQFVLATALRPASVATSDLVSPTAAAIAKSKGITVPELIVRRFPDLDEFLRFFPPGTVKHREVDLKYIPLAVSAPDSPLERITALRLNGMYGQVIYEQLIMPRL